MFKIVFSALVLALLSCTNLPTQQIDHSQPGFAQTSAERFPSSAGADGRGSLFDYDPGPPKDSKWPDLFAETPNYRAYGKAVYISSAKQTGLEDDGHEKFRWIVGPMWYRGRLTPDSVKIFVIGQEGAQDENISNRTFTGSTGTKMQNLLNYFGVNRSYLFMNTFMYTIEGQYGEFPEKGDKPLVVQQKKMRSQAMAYIAQDPHSVVVQHRQKMFDYMLSQNASKLRLVIGVGAAGKDTLATWIRSHGGNCTTAMLSQTGCDASALGKGIYAIGVMHPGAASPGNGGEDAAAALKVEFTKKAKIVTDLAQKKKDWLVADDGVKTDFTIPYVYGNAVIPHGDFAFGTNWRLGFKEGTTSNRRGADGIQIFSSNGCYNNKAREAGKCSQTKNFPVVYDEPADIDSKMSMAAGDVPWESPKSEKGRRDFDPGPGNFASHLTGTGASGWPDFTSLGVTSHSSFGLQGLYRGRFDDPKVLVVADQESHDDMFSGRALTGTGGQRLQTFLSAMGIGDDYLILRTLPVDTLDLNVEKVKDIALNPDVVKMRNDILNSVLHLGKTKLILAVGPVAQKVMQSFSTQIPIKNLDSPLAPEHVQQWQSTLAQIGGLHIEGAQVSQYDGSLTAIPRGDLPSHTRWWMGTSGSRASRGYTGDPAHRLWTGDYYKFDAPTWVNASKYPASPKELSNDETTSVQVFNKGQLLEF